jgi:hypothetical protein
MENYLNIIAILAIILLALLVQIARNVNWLYETQDLRNLVKSILSSFKSRKTKSI